MTRFSVLMILAALFIGGMACEVKAQNAHSTIAIPQVGIPQAGIAPLAVVQTDSGQAADDSTAQSSPDAGWPTYQNEPTQDTHLIQRGPGWYFAIWKIVLVVFAFVIWIKFADFINQDAVKVGEETGLTAEIWNPIIAFTFFAGFLFVITFPLFFLGYPVFLGAAIAPIAIYIQQRNSKVDPADTIFTKAHRIRRREQKLTAVGAAPPTPVLKQDTGLPVEFKVTGLSGEKAQAALIRARQFPAYLTVKEIVFRSVRQRVDQVLLDYTREQVAFRQQIDGFWHTLPPMDRMVGDEILVVLKMLAGLDPQERRAKQSGSFGASFPDYKLVVELKSQGVPTGERVQIKFALAKKANLSLPELGILPRMENELKQRLNSPGLVLASCRPGDGMTTSWNAVISSADRMMRDFHGVAPEGHDDTKVENIDFHHYAPGDPKAAEQVMKSLRLRLPEAYVMPESASGGLVDLVAAEVNNNKRFAITRNHSKSLFESIARMVALNPERSEFAKALTAVLYWRLARRLCDYCKQPYQPSPQLLHKLQLSPEQVPQLYREWQPPPPEELVDEKGRPIEVQLCQVCAGIGYIGRIAIYELLIVEEEVRRAIVNDGTAAGIEAAARKAGHHGLQAAGLNLVVAGVTSLSELQRVLKN